MIWTLRKKILIGYGMALILLILVFVWALIYMFRLGQASNAILQNNYNSILAADNMLGAMERQDSATLLVILGYYDDGINQFHKNERVFLEWFGKAKDNITEKGETEAINIIDNEYSSYLIYFSKLVEIHHLDPKKSAIYYHETVLTSFILVRDTCLQLREINQNAMFETSERARHISENSVLSMAIIGIVALGIGIVFSVILSNFLVKPLKQITEATKKVAVEDYSHKVLIRSNDELGVLANEFNVMMEKLREYRELNIGQIISEKQKSDAIIKSIDDGVIVIDTKYNITNINPTAVRFLNINFDVIKGRHFLEVIKNEGLFDYVKQCQ